MNPSCPIRKPSPRLRLFCRRQSQLIVERHGPMGFIDLLLNNREELGDIWYEAQRWTDNAIKAIRSAADPNPYRNSTDDEIAQVVLDRIEARLKRPTDV